MRKDGGQYWAHEVINRLLDDSGKLKGFVRITRDLTDQHETQQKLEKLSLAVEQSPMSMAIADRDGHIEYVNKAFCDLASIQPEGAKKLSIDGYFKAALSDEQKASLVKAMADGKAWSARVMPDARSRKAYDAILTPLHAQGDLATHLLLTLEDVHQEMPAAALRA